jgi:hypothetical protein
VFVVCVEIVGPNRGIIGADSIRAQASGGGLALLPMPGQQLVQLGGRMVGKAAPRFASSQALRNLSHAACSTVISSSPARRSTSDCKAPFSIPAAVRCGLLCVGLAISTLGFPPVSEGVFERRRVQRRLLKLLL